MRHVSGSHGDDAVHRVRRLHQQAPVVIEGERLVDRAVRVLREGGCDPVYVVLGAWTGDVPGAVAVANPEWPEGMGSSLRAGLTALEGETVDVTITGTGFDMTTFGGGLSLQWNSNVLDLDSVVDAPWR